MQPQDKIHSNAVFEGNVLYSVLEQKRASGDDEVRVSVRQLVS
jgi:hypothetical protein